MRKFLVVLAVLVLASSLSAQSRRTGNIYGTVVDTDGNPLPGVTVTLTGSLTAPMTSIASAEGVFRFLSLAVGTDYTVKAELEGFRTEIRENIIVVLGANVEVTLTMEMGALEEEVTVTAVTPVVDTKRTTVGENVTRDVLQSLPSARDPWVILQQAPGIAVDRENVGGSESGQQTSYNARGGGSNQWAMDGVLITDPASISSPSYFDFDAFEEMNVTTGGSDVSVQTGGVAMNLVTRRGGNRVSIGGRIYFTDEKFQAENFTEEMAAEGLVGTNVIRNIKDYGFNLGGPLFVDKAWWWISFGAQDIKTANVYGTPDDTLLVNYAGKLNIQLIPENRFEAFAHIGQKEKFGRGAGYSFPRGWHQTGRYHFGSPIVKFQDEHMFGDSLFLSAKYSFANSGFNMIPVEDEDRQNLLEYDQANRIYNNTYYNYICNRPLNQFVFSGNYFNDVFLGASHEVKFGFEYSYRGQDDLWETNGGVFTYFNYNGTSVDIDGDNQPDVIPEMRRWEAARQGYNEARITAYTGYLSDTITFGRFNLILGLRYDYQTPSVPAYTVENVDDSNVWNTYASPAAKAAVDKFLPGFDIPEISPDWAWKTWSPRAGFTYDLLGDGKTLLKGSWAMYGEFMGVGYAGEFKPVGYGGWVDYYWFDDPSLGGNGNGILDLTEMYWTEPGDYTPRQIYDASGNFLVDYKKNEEWMWGGFDPDNPQAAGDPRYTQDPSYGSMRTNEFILTLEREVIVDFGVALDLTYRRLDHHNWDLRWDGENEATIESKDWYTQVGTIPANMDGYDANEAAGRSYYLWKDDPNVTSWYPRYSTRRPDYYQDYMGVEVRFNKRLSNKWMFNGSATYQMQKQHFGDNGELDPTRLWATDNVIYAYEMGGNSGKGIDAHVFPRWMVKLSGLYQFPLDFNASFTFNAREGHIIPWQIDIVDTVNNPNSYSTSTWTYLEEYGKLRLPNFWNINFRLEKVIRAGDYGRIYLMADVFNLFNMAHENRRYPKDHGTYYVSSETVSKNATDYLLYEVLNPRVIRFGIRFDY